jgi:hypothetical protein
MPRVDKRGAGLDVHKQTVMACVVPPAGPEPCSFGTMTAALLTRAAWRLISGGMPVAMEWTADDWTPGFTRLEGTCEPWLVHAPHVKAGPGRKTDINDAALLTDLLLHGLLRASFYSAGGSAGTAGLDALSPPLHPGAGAPEEPGAAAVGRGPAYAGGGSPGGSGRAILAARLTGHAGALSAIPATSSYSLLPGERCTDIILYIVFSSGKELSPCDGYNHRHWPSGAVRIPGRPRRVDADKARSCGSAISPAGAVASR